MAQNSIIDPTFSQKKLLFLGVWQAPNASQAESIEDDTRWLLRHWNDHRSHNLDYRFP